ncbi:hypothetical protein [Merismopedia glauca]|uniref:Uncharacterized protein n=1 Tax=Merismopedia glauca CCAP 1448/3 TaxID=1296344 RepID=A0A2T1C5L4_9CYAN|nr:hypothetical protein [Merismopedia glauca]PSB03551.1 hypothetical protein C7B64_07825 [Merismopedia glauca CCAP 1448/3]
MAPPNPAIMQAVEQLGYRVTVGDIASQAGLKIDLAQQGLLALASDAGGHMQVSETGEVVYLFPQDFRNVLRNKFWRLQLQQWWEKIWKILFYLIRISFGIVLVASIGLIYLAITLILLSSVFNNDDNNSGGSGSSGFSFFYFPDLFWIFTPDYNTYERRQSSSSHEPRKLNFLEAIFSFLFGDGNPNAELEKRRWLQIATQIRQHQGAIVAEQISPYLDDIGSQSNQEYEDYVLPVLTKFNGVPEVSPDGEIVYHFPELQTTAVSQQLSQVSAYLREKLWRFSDATSGQITLAIGLGAINIIGALVLFVLLRGGLAIKIGGLIGFVNGILGLLMVYGIGFLAIPLIRYFWIKWKNNQIEVRNQQRQSRAVYLNQAPSQLQHKIAYARQFAQQNYIGTGNIAYTTEEDLIEQQIERSDQIDAEWEKRLRQQDL